MKKINLKKYLYLWIGLATFIGFAIGRLSSIILPICGLHHWICGLIIMAISPLFYKNWWWSIMLGFGIGMLVSDLTDFTNFKIYGCFDVPQYNFWGIN